MRRPNFLLVTSGVCMVLVAAAGYLLVHHIAPAPTMNSLGIVAVQRTAHPDELVFSIRPTAVGDELSSGLVMRFFVDDPAAGSGPRVLDSWNMTAMETHISNTTGWPTITRLRAVTEEGPGLSETRWIWRGNFTLASSTSLSGLARAIEES